MQHVGAAFCLLVLAPADSCFCLDLLWQDLLWPVCGRPLEKALNKKVLSEPFASHDLDPWTWEREYPVKISFCSARNKLQLIEAQFKMFWSWWVVRPESCYKGRVLHWKLSCQLEGRQTLKVDVLPSPWWWLNGLLHTHTAPVQRWQCRNMCLYIITHTSRIFDKNISRDGAIVL